MANRYWVGSGTNFNTTASWASFSGGPAGASVPTTADVPIFDSNSGDAIVNVPVPSISTAFTNVSFDGYSNTIQMDQLIRATVFTFGTQSISVSGTSSIVPVSGTIISAGGNWSGRINPITSCAFNLSSTFSIGRDIFISGNVTLNSPTYSIITNGYRNTSATSYLSGTARIVFKGGTWSGLLRNSVEIDGDLNIPESSGFEPNAATASLKYTSGTVLQYGTFSTATNTSSGLVTLDTAGMTFSNLTIRLLTGTSYLTLGSTISVIECFTPPDASGAVVNFLGSGSLAVTGFLNPQTNTNAWVKTYNLNNAGWFINNLQMPSGSLTINNFSMNTGTLFIAALLNGTTVLRLGYGGTWSGTSAGRLKSSVDFIGNYAVQGDVWWQFLGAPSGEPSRTMSYVTGSIYTQGSRLSVGELRDYSYANFNTAGMYWDQIRFFFVSGGLMSLASDLYTSGTMSIVSSSPGGTTIIGSTGQGTIRANSFLVDVNSSLAPKNDWYVGKLVGTASTLHHNTSTYSIVCDRGIEFNNTVYNGAKNSELILSGGTLTNTVNQTTITGNFAIRPDSPVSINTSILIPNGYQIRYLNGASTVSIAMGTTLSLGQNLVAGQGTTCSTYPIIWEDILVPQGMGNPIFLGSTLSNNGTWLFNNTTMNQPFTYSLNLGYVNPLNTLVFRTTGTTQSYTIGPVPNLNTMIFNSTNVVGTTLTLNSGTINLNSLIQSHTGLTASTLGGSSTIRFKGTGTWSGNYVVSNNVVFDNGANTLVLDTGLKYQNGTITYTSGLINSTANTLLVNGNATFSTRGMNWNNVNITGNRNIAFGNTFSLTGLLSLTGSVGFTGSGGFYVNSLYSVGSVTHSFRRGAIYTVTNALTLQGVGTASKMNFVSDTSGVQAIFTLVQGASQSINYVSARDIDSSQGRTVRNFRGQISNTLNWLLLPASYTTFYVDGI